MAEDVVPSSSPAWFCLKNFAFLRRPGKESALRCAERLIGSEHFVHGSLETKA
jgi:hypothetical protein